MDESTSMVALLPEGKLFERVFSEGIAPAAAECSRSVVRLDSEFSTEEKLASICRALQTAGLVIADVTGKNPNVLFELGYARGARRKVLLIAQHLEDFPFDKRKNEVIAYAGDPAVLRRELIDFLRSGSTRKGSEPDGTESAREKFISIFRDILDKHGHEHRGEIQQENATTFVLMEQDMDLPLVQDLSRRARERGLRIKLM